MKRQFSACKPLAACIHLSSTVSQLFEAQLQKNRRFQVPQPTFLFPLETPLRLSRNMLHGWKDNSMLAKPLAACAYLYLIVSELYDAYSMRKSKNRYFFHMFVSPGDAPGAITLDVVWMEREFDAYKLSRCMCPSNYKCFWDRARFWSKIVIFSHPLAFDAPVRGVSVWIAPPRLVWKNQNSLATRWWKKNRRYVYSFWRNSRTWQTDSHRMPAIAALMYSIARQKQKKIRQKRFSIWRIEFFHAEMWHVALG